MLLFIICNCIEIMIGRVIECVKNGVDDLTLHFKWQCLIDNFVWFFYAKHWLTDCFIGCKTDICRNKLVWHDKSSLTLTKKYVN